MCTCSHPVVLEPPSIGPASGGQEEWRDTLHHKPFPKGCGTTTIIIIVTHLVFQLQRRGPRGADEGSRCAKNVEIISSSVISRKTSQMNQTTVSSKSSSTSCGSTRNAPAPVHFWLLVYLFLTLRKIPWRRHDALFHLNFPHVLFIRIGQDVDRF